MAKFFFSLLVASVMATTAAAESGMTMEPRTSGAASETTCSVTAWPGTPAWPGDGKYPAWPGDGKWPAWPGDGKYPAWPVTAEP